MTRFWNGLERGKTYHEGIRRIERWGDIYFKDSSFKITDLAQAMFQRCNMPEIGIREDEFLK